MTAPVALPAQGATPWTGWGQWIHSVIAGMPDAVVAPSRALTPLFAGLNRATVAPCRIAFTGSSTTAGQNATAPAKRYVDRLIARLQAAYPSGLGSESAVVASTTASWGTLTTAVGVHGYNAGEGGTSSSSYLTSGEVSAIASLAPAAVFHMIGANDYAALQVPVATYKANVAGRIADLKAAISTPHVHVLVHSYPRTTTATPVATWAAYGQALAEIAAADPTRVVFVDLSTHYERIGWPGTNPWSIIDTDGVHQTDPGHALMADLLAHALGVPVTPGMTTTTTVTNTITGGSSVASSAGGPGTATTLFGWSGDAIPNLEQDILGTWMAPDSWTSLNNGDYLYPGGNSQLDAFRVAHPDRAVDIGTPLVPHKMTGTTYNALLDEAAGGTRDQLYRNMGAALAGFSPRLCYARIWWEMNMRPDPADTIDRAKFIAAWRRAVPLIREGFAAAAKPGQTIKIVFCPISDGADYDPFWPGGDVVDVISMDPYAAKYGTTVPSSADLLAWTGAFLTNLAAYAAAKGKPLSIGEFGNWQPHAADGSTDSRGRGDFPEYISQVMDWVAANPVEYLVYFNLSSGGVGITLADTPNSLATLRRRVNDLRTVRAAPVGPDGKLADSARPVPRVLPRPQSAAYTFALADAAGAVEHTGATAATYTVPTNATVPFPIGTVIEVAQLGAGQVTLAGATGVTLRTASSLTTRAQFSTLSLRKRAVDEWVVAGDLT